MTHTYAPLAALLLLGLATTATALPSLPALPTPPVGLGQDLQTPVGGATAAVQGKAVRACADAMAPALPVAMPHVPLPVAVPTVTNAGACIDADVDARSAGISIHGPAQADIGTDGASIQAGPIKTEAKSPFQAFLGWLTGLL